MRWSRFLTALLTARARFRAVRANEVDPCVVPACSPGGAPGVWSPTVGVRRGAWAARLHVSELLPWLGAQEWRCDAAEPAVPQLRRHGRRGRHRRSDKPGISRARRLLYDIMVSAARADVEAWLVQLVACQRNLLRSWRSRTGSPPLLPSPCCRPSIPRPTLAPGCCSRPPPASQVRIVLCAFTSNVGGRGGAIRIAAGSNVSLVDSLFLGNTAT